MGSRGGGGGGRVQRGPAGPRCRVCDQQHSQDHGGEPVGFPGLRSASAHVPTAAGGCAKGTWETVRWGGCCRRLRGWRCRRSCSATCWVAEHACPGIKWHGKRACLSCKQAPRPNLLPVLHTSTQEVLLHPDVRPTSAAPPSSVPHNHFGLRDTADARALLAALDPDNLLAGSGEGAAGGPGAGLDGQRPGGAGGAARIACPAMQSACKPHERPYT